MAAAERGCQRWLLKAAAPNACPRPPFPHLLGLLHARGPVLLVCRIRALALLLWLRASRLLLGGKHLRSGCWRGGCMQQLRECCGQLLK